MCYAIPGRVERIEGRIATVRYFDETRRAVNEMDDLAPGDYVYAQGGFVISKVAPPANTRT